ncbi:MAG TPA: 50S ribosomal protein L25/general stress protein Ctc [Candidatus Angelobacter sp.]|jgi:large subunit ribosomal protein L25|nr:50S ribosomal protein L25/general stress protein Ctc [Candidatus Angelobacter sp.]
MISQEVVEAQPRQDSSRGKNEARRLRASGRVPAVIYGAKKASLAISVDPKQISKILRSESGHNTIFELQLNGDKAQVMIVDWQYDPMKGKLLHIDLKRIAMDERIKVEVPIHLVGEAAGVKQQGGILDQVLREVEIECLPSDIPSHIDADVSELVFGTVLRVSDLPHTGSIKFITDASQTVAHITSVKEEVAPTPDAAAAEAAATPAEPEVIKKGKQETEEEAAAPEGKEGKKSPEGKK